MHRFEVAAFSPDGRALVTVDDGAPEPTGGLQGLRSPTTAVVRVWDAVTGEKWQQMTVAGAWVVRSGFEADGRLRLHTMGGGIVRLRLSPEPSEPEVTWP